MSSMKCMKVLLIIMISLLISSHCLRISSTKKEIENPKDTTTDQEKKSEKEDPQEIKKEEETTDEKEPASHSNDIQNEVSSEEKKKPIKKSTFDASSDLAGQNETAPGYSQYEVIPDYTLPEGPIYAKGWLKYTSFDKDTSNNKPKEFLKNTAFYEQMKKGETLDLTKNDTVGFINVPDEDHFFFILTENSLNVLSSRKVIFLILNNLK